CKEGNTYSAGVCEQNGGFIRSTNNAPTNCTSSACSDWVDITPNSTDYKKYFSIGLEKLTDLIPANKPIPGATEFQGKLFVIRNACMQALWDNSCAFSSNCSDDMLCPAGQEVPQLWKCDPGLSGNANECDSGDWTLVAQNSSTGKTNFGDTNNNKITMVAGNGDYLYVGFDNVSTGIEVWRTNVTNPSLESDFSQIGGDGFGSGTNITEIYDHVSLNNGSVYYLYLSIGKNSVPVRVHRQQNIGPVVLNNILHPKEETNLIAYIGKWQNLKYAMGFFIFASFLILLLHYIRNARKSRSISP
ncbi:MAG: hypothetical protein KDK45_06380, partial [Leptospiraceae bacterium]|nr:hypothetical protein [Leptospiraceae bacterium]